MSNKKFSRRNFIRQTTCASLGSLTFLSTWKDLQAAGALALLGSAPPDDYKALVCIAFNGGNDSYNMLVPYNEDSYNQYSNVRSNVALPKDDLHLLNFTDNNGKQFGVNPEMQEVQSLFNENKLSFISNVGTLVEPIPNKAAYENNLNSLPLGLYSHEDQMQQWQTSVPHERSVVGWGGKVADLLHESVNGGLSLSMNISLGNTNIFQSGNEFSEYVISPTIGSSGILDYGMFNEWSTMKTNVINSLLEHSYDDMFKRTYANTVKYAQNTHALFSGALQNFDITTPFSGNDLSQSLKMVARTIGIRNQLGLKRQIFYIDFGSWDDHQALIGAHSARLGDVSIALSEFYQALEDLGVENDVTTFTISDFGRTLTSNGDGTDHAWSGHQMVMGGSVNGGQIYGTYPDIDLDSEFNLFNNGVLIPQMSTDEYFAELALWLGVPKSKLVDIFPNIRNFYNVCSSNNPVGFMSL